MYCSANEYEIYRFWILFSVRQLSTIGLFSDTEASIAKLLKATTTRRFLLLFICDSNRFLYLFINRNRCFLYFFFSSFTAVNGSIGTIKEIHWIPSSQAKHRKKGQFQVWSTLKTIFIAQQNLSVILFLLCFWRCQRRPVNKTSPSSVNARNNQTNMRNVNETRQQQIIIKKTLKKTRFFICPFHRRIVYQIKIIIFAAITVSRPCVVFRI